MNITPEWITAISSLVAAIAACGAWLSSRGVASKLKIIENRISVKNSPVFNMGDSASSIVAGESIRAGGDITTGARRK
jgi:hypothetical protein